MLWEVPDRIAAPRGGGRGRPRAFTLVELLVVIAVIALLIAILLPSLAESRRAARDAGCRSNLHQIAVGASAYAATHRDRYPEKLGDCCDPPRCPSNLDPDTPSYVHLATVSTPGSWQGTARCFDMCFVPLAMDVLARHGPARRPCRNTGYLDGHTRQW